MRKSRTAFEDFLRGGEVFRHRMGMLFANLGLALIVAIVVAIVTAWLLALATMSPDQRALAGYYVPARTAQIFGLGKSRMLARDVEIAGQALPDATPDEIVLLLRRAYERHAALRVWLIFFASVGAFGTTLFLLPSFWRRFGQKLVRDEFRRGARVVEAQEIEKLVLARHESHYRFCGVPIPSGYEMRNFLATGSMGSGKSVALLDLAEQVAERGRKMVIYDKVGEFTEVFYRPERDVILNPFDTRSVHWNVFREIRAIYDFDVLAAALIKDAKNSTGNDQFFKAGARALFAAVLNRLHQDGQTQTKVLARTLLKTPAEELAKLVEGTPAEAFITPKAAQQAGGVVAELVGALIALQYVEEGDFSIREWIARDDDSRLFITSNELVHDALRPLLSMWLEIALRAAMALPRTREDRIWFFIDEMPSLGALDILKQSLVEARKFGVVHVLGVQNVAQIRDAFNKDVAQVLRANLQNFLVLRVSDEETAEAYSKLLGSFEQDERDETVSFGDSSSRDGSATQISRKEVRLVMPSELQRLPDCTGYLQVAGAWPLAKVSYKPVSRDKVAEPYMQRPDLVVSPGTDRALVSERKHKQEQQEEQPEVQPQPSQVELQDETKREAQEPEGAEVVEMEYAKELLQTITEEIRLGKTYFEHFFVERNGELFLLVDRVAEHYSLDTVSLAAHMSREGMGSPVEIELDGGVVSAIALSPAARGALEDLPRGEDQANDDVELW